MLTHRVRGAAAVACFAALFATTFAQLRSGLDLHLNGEVTLSENIGDLGGLAVAARAYRISLGNQASPVIIGFTGDQRLFIGWAQLWRSEIRDEYLRQTVLVSHHVPARHRANGAALNLDTYLRRSACGLAISSSSI